MSPAVDSSRDVGLQGHFAGVVSRFVAFAIDALTVVVLFTLAAKLVEFLVTILSGQRFVASEHRVLAIVTLAAWTFLYFAYSFAADGRTLGMAVVGLRVVRRDGGSISGARAVVRVLALPVSFLAFGLGLLLVLVERERRALHDVIAGTVVVYAWDARAARLRFLATTAPS
jgi:uncharacterized RDD family membrane protein YckC